MEINRLGINTLTAKMHHQMGNVLCKEASMNDMKGMEDMKI